MLTIFLIGATGYVGGDFLHAFKQANVDHCQITCLVRDAQKESQLHAAFADVNIVKGSLDDAEVIERMVSDADIVLNLASSSHMAGAQAIAKGLSMPKRPRKQAYWIQIAGATILASEEISKKHYGHASACTYDSLHAAQKVRSLITSNQSRIPENIVISQDTSKVKTALLTAPLIYGKGRGPCHQRSIQAPEIAKATLKLGYGFCLGEGKNVWSNVHIADLSELVVALVGDAVGNEGRNWCEDSIYLPENGEMAFGALCAQIAREAHTQSLIQSPDVKEVIDAKRADQLSGHAAVLWGTNARARSTKERTILKWTPTGASLEQEIQCIVRNEATTSSSK